MLQIKTFVKNPLENNNYLVIDNLTHEAILIDCSSEGASDIMRYVEANKLHLKYILLTHGHFDHVLGVNWYKENYKIPAYMHEGDLSILEKMNVFMQMMRQKPVEVPQIERTFTINDSFSIGGRVIKIIHTPGHTMGSVCFLIDDMLFSGDTLFKDGFGRLDMAGVDVSLMRVKMLYSLNKLKLLNPHITVFPGHGDKTTIRDELDNIEDFIKRNNLAND